VHGVELFVEGYLGSGGEVLCGDYAGAVFPWGAVEGVGAGRVVFSRLEIGFDEGLGVGYWGWGEWWAFVIVGAGAGAAGLVFGVASVWRCGGLKSC